jgi:RNA polymerase sigma factor (sigma-70 family)
MGKMTSETASEHGDLLRDMQAHGAWLRRLAGSLVAGEPLVEDVLQETWAAAVRSPPAPRDTRRPWLATTLRNIVFSRRRSDRQRRLREAGYTGTAPDRLPSPEELLVRQEALALVAQEVRALPEPYRSTILLCYMEGVSSAEISRRQEVPAGTVRWRLKYGLDRLRARLEERYGPDRKRWAVALGLGWPADAQVLAAPTAKAIAASALVAVGLGLGLGLGRGCPGAEETPSIRAALAPAQVRSAGAPPPGAPAPARPMEAAACAERLRAREAELVEAEAELRRVSPPDQAWRASPPDDGGRERLAPVLERILAGVPEPPSHTVECRRHACRLVIVEPENAPRRDRWMRPLQLNAELAALVEDGPLFSGEGGSRRDPLTGSWLRQSVVYWKLPAGARIEPPAPSPAGCPTRLAEVEARLAAARDAIEENRPIEERFASGARMPAVEDEVRALVARTLTELGKPDARTEVGCRGGVCRIDLRTTAPEGHRLLQQVMGAQAMRVRFDSQASMGATHVLLPLRDPASGESLAVLLDLHQRFKASGAVQACRSRLGGDTPLGGTMWIGALGDAPDDAEQLPNGVTFSFGARILATPDGACVVEAFRSAARQAQPPSHRAPASLGFWLVRPAG